MVVGSHRDVSEIEKGMDVRSQGDPVGYLVLPDVRERFDVAGLKHWNRVLPTDRASALVRIEHEFSKRSLPEGGSAAKPAHRSRQMDLQQREADRPPAR